MKADDLDLTEVYVDDDVTGTMKSMPRIFQKRLFNSWLKQEDLMIELQTNRVNEKLTNFDKRNKGIVHLSMLVDDI